jgi:hypothetical protein
VADKDDPLIGMGLERIARDARESAARTHDPTADFVRIARQNNEAVANRRRAAEERDIRIMRAVEGTHEQIRQAEERAKNANERAEAAEAREVAAQTRSEARERLLVRLTIVSVILAALGIATAVAIAIAVG